MPPVLMEALHTVNFICRFLLTGSALSLLPHPQRGTVSDLKPPSPVDWKELGIAKHNTKNLT